MTCSNGQLYMTWNEFHNIVRNMCKKIEQKIDRMIIITRGGLVAGQIISHELNIRSIDTISLQSYDNQQRARLNILKPCELNLEHVGTILVVDEIADSGETMKFVRDYLQHPNTIYSSVIIKPNASRMVDVYGKMVEQHEWVHFPWENE